MWALNEWVGRGKYAFWGRHVRIRSSGHPMKLARLLDEIEHAVKMRGGSGTAPGGLDRVGENGTHPDLLVPSLCNSGLHRSQ